MSPRGLPVTHANLELSRERFSSPVPVDVVGLEGLPPLFGAEALMRVHFTAGPLVTSRLKRWWTKEGMP